jgi:purine-nucleoside phosphorylase
LKVPLKYDPEAAKSEREKFRDKVIKLVNNQLEVDYFDNVRLKDRTMVTYKGHEMEEQKVETKSTYSGMQSSSKYSRILIRKDSRKHILIYLMTNSKLATIIFTTTDIRRDVILCIFWNRRNPKRSLSTSKPKRGSLR